jgi:membrane protein DedA with SNARE-associated domain
VPTAAISAKATAAGAGGVTGSLGLLVLSECGIPMPVPADVLMLLVGERAAAGVLPLWLAALAFALIAAVGTSTLFLLARGPGQAVLARLGPRVGLGAERIERVSAALARRGRHALAVGRGTPGLRTLTVVASASSALPARVALPLLVLGSTVFLEAHLVLGYLLGPAAAELVRRAGPLLVAMVVLLAVVVLVRSVVRHRAGVAPVQAWSEGVCPACLAVTAVERRSSGR